METKDILIGLAVGLFVGLLAGGGVFYFRQSRANKNEDTSQTSPLTTAEPTEMDMETEEEPTATPEPTQALEKEDLSIQVLNGSGAPGAAGDGQNYLEELGYENISVGNADSYGYEQTEVYIKEELKGMVEQLVNDLQEEYEVEVQSEYLDEDSDYDIRVIIGAS
jgi:hypothetical protein